MLREEEDPFLMAAWTEIPWFACPFERSDERSKVIISALRVSTAYPGYTFGIITTVQKLKDCFLDPYDAKLYVSVCVLFLVAILKFLEVVFKNGLNNLPASGSIDWYMDVHTMFKQERQEEISFKK
jgi:hypothetical protein